MWKRAATTSAEQEEAVFRAAMAPPKITSVAASTSPVLELAEAVREACWMSSCLTPWLLRTIDRRRFLCRIFYVSIAVYVTYRLYGARYVVLCSLEPSKVDVAAPLSETIPEHVPPVAGQIQTRNRASAAWHNYHTCIELAKQEVAAMTGGAALVVELLVEGHIQEPYVSIGYGLREFEIDVVSRPPGQAVKKGIDRSTLVKTFIAFDADGSGAVDAEELKAAATKQAERAEVAAQKASMARWLEWMRGGPAGGLRRQHRFTRAPTGWAQSAACSGRDMTFGDNDDLEGLSTDMGRRKTRMGYPKRSSDN